MNPRNIGWLGGVYYADPKVKEAWEFRILRLKTSISWVNGYTNYSLRMECGRKSFVTNTWGLKPFLKFVGNPVIHIFGVAWWRPRNSFSNLVLSRLGMVLRFDSGKTHGRGPLHLWCNTLACIGSSDTNSSRSNKNWDKKTLIFLFARTFFGLAW